jgi:hypothetical protein
MDAKAEDVSHLTEPLGTMPVTEEPPDGGYGWVQVGVAFTINCFTWGQTAVNIPSYIFDVWV